MSEFCTLCGVEACLIMYDDDNGDVGPMTWPQDPIMVRSIIQNYELQLKKNKRPHKNFDIEDFFENRNNMVEAEISKVHKQITNIKYPIWDPIFKNMEEEQLKAFIDLVNAKIEACDHRINMLKNHSEANFSVMQNMIQASASSSHPSQIIPTPMDPLNDNNGRMDFTNTINQIDRACNHGINNTIRNMQQ
ncbi:Agamous-like MADS-box protein, partial [Mucuna pruriens]